MFLFIWYFIRYYLIENFIGIVIWFGKFFGGGDVFVDWVVFIVVVFKLLLFEELIMFMFVNCFVGEMVKLIVIVFIFCIICLCVG